jgi:hypothetical protein
VRTKLIESGVPPAEIAFIHDADSDAEKKTLFDAVNAGRTRILIGSTEKMGAGTNVQKRLAALHHLDAPLRPRDIEQREGRILRQGDGGRVEPVPPGRRGHQDNQILHPDYGWLTFLFPRECADRLEMALAKQAAVVEYIGRDAAAIDGDGELIH